MTTVPKSVQGWLGGVERPEARWMTNDVDQGRRGKGVIAKNVALC